MRILFVDDTRDTREMFKMAFRLKGHETVVAQDGQEAIDIVARETAFDAIILDVEMPRMNGWAAVRVLRQLQHARTAIIIMFTAYGNGDYREKALELGANDLWHKPLLPAEMLARLQDFSISKA